MHHPTARLTHTTAFGTPVVEYWLEWEIDQWVHYMNDRSVDPSHHERTFLPRSYISLHQRLQGVMLVHLHLIKYLDDDNTRNLTLEQVPVWL